MVVCVLLQVLFHHIADRLQSAAGFLVFSDMRMELGAHLRRMPMGYFTEGNIGKISSLLSSDMVFIEENCMTVLADMMSYIFAQAILVVFLLCFDLRIGLAALVIIGVVLLIAQGMKREALQDSVARQEQNEKPYRGGAGLCGGHRDHQDLQPAGRKVPGADGQLPKELRHQSPV